MLHLHKATDKVAAEKVRKAVVDLLFRSPLFGLTILGTAIRVEEKHGIPTMCTDGRTIWYGPEWVHKKSQPSIMFDLLHECLHCFGNHPARRGERDHKTWGYAIDVRVAHDGLRICRVRGPWELDSDHVPALAWAEHLSAEQIYEKLLKNPHRVPKDYVPDTIDPPEGMTEEEDQQFKRDLTQDLAQAQLAEEQALGALTGGKKGIEELYGSGVWERLQELKRCEVPWNVLLQGRLVSSLGNEQASWVPPSRRWFPQIAMPSRRGTQEEELLLGIDVSGSITEEVYARFRACILPAARRAKRTTVVTFDAVVRECITTTRPDSLLRSLKGKTGSHSYTDVRGVFEEVDKRRPTAVAIITDGYIKLPHTPYPKTHWIVTPTGQLLPWGMNYKLKEAW
jgi:predicted metal-dependent peptidase